MMTEKKLKATMLVTICSTTAIISILTTIPLPSTAITEIFKWYFILQGSAIGAYQVAQSVSDKLKKGDKDV